MAATELLQKNIIAVITIHKLEQAAPLAEALAMGGITTLEITLRTEIALTAISNLRKDYPELIIGAGTVLEPHQFKQLKNAGAQFAVSPASSLKLLTEAAAQNLLFLPGVATCTEVLQAKELGFNSQKFFPANLAGGISMLRHFAQLFPVIKFCPTGGINDTNHTSYLKQPNVIAVGGSWLAPAKLIENAAWLDITKLAKTAVQNSRGIS